MPSISLICDVVILIGAVVVAITNIWKFFAKPTARIRNLYGEEAAKRFRESLARELPRAINEQKISESLLENVMPLLEEIKQMNAEQNEKIDILMTSSRDMLREKILSIYYAHQKDKKLRRYERDALDLLFKDYKTEGGNSYIDKCYSIMSKWQVEEEEFL